MRGRYITPPSRRPISMLMVLICSHPFLSQIRADGSKMIFDLIIMYCFFECVVSPSCKRRGDDLQLPRRTCFPSACRRPVAVYYALKPELISRLFISADGSDYR